jgi:hypothetical protein
MGTGALRRGGEPDGHGGGRRAAVRRRVLVCLFVVAVAVAAHAAWVAPDRPGVTTPEGWYAGYDQSRYLREAQQLASGELPRTSYLYGLGYPLVAVPAIALGFDGDPFTPADVAAFGTAMVLIAVVGERMRSLAFGVVAAGAIGLASPLLDLMVTPWNSTVTVLAVLAALAATTSPGRLTWRHGAVVGLAVGAAFAARYVDAAFPAVIGAAGLLSREDRTPASIAAAAGVSALLACAVLWTHVEAFGDPLKTPYHLHERDGRTDQDLGTYDIGTVPRHALEVLVTGSPDGDDSFGRPLVQRFPWVVAAPVGLLLVARRRGPARRPLVAAAAMSVVGATFYFSFPAGGGSDLRFDNLRYHVAWFPVWGLLAAHALVTVAAAVTARTAPGLAAPKLAPLDGGPSS